MTPSAGATVKMLWETEPMVKEDFNLGKYKISKGTALGISYVTLQRKPEYYDEPRKFDLEKYDKPVMKELKKCGFTPFSSGKRPCPGKNLEELAIKMIVANLVNEFELFPSDEPNRRMIEMNYRIKHCKVRLRIL